MIPGNANPLLLASAAEAAAPAAGPIKSLRFNPGDSAYLNKTFSSGNRRTFTYSYWIKESGKGTSPSNNPHVLWSGADASTRGGLAHRGTGSDAGKLYTFNQESNSTNCQAWTNSLHRDFSAWKHIVWSIDTTQSTSTNRVKLYINGVQETLYFATTPAQNLQLQININQEHRIGRGTPDDYGNFYLADIHFIDGSQLDATSFGAFDSSGVWQVAEYDGTFGTNGFHLLDFANESTVGHDSSGNENDFTANNISTFDGTIAAASGALPILNTTGSYGGTVGSGTRTDSNSSSIVLALPMNGTNGGTTFTDQSATIKGSGSAKTITRNGDVDTVTSLSQFYGSSAEFDGTGDYLTFSHTGGLGSGDFTIEYWVYHDSLYNFITHFCNTRGSVGFNVGTDSAGNFVWYDQVSSSGRKIEVLGVISANRWYHAAFVRSGTTITAYLDGVSKGTYTSSANYSDSSFTIGALNDGGEVITGHMQDVRMYVGAAKYTSNFNPPSRTGGSGCDSLFDVPTNGTQSDTGAGGEVSGNYCTWNPLVKGPRNNGADSSATFSQGNLRILLTGSGDDVAGTISVSSGKWYYELTLHQAQNHGGGWCLADDFTSDSYSSSTGGIINGDGYYGTAESGSSSIIVTKGSTASATNQFNDGSIIGYAFDIDAGTLKIYVDGVLETTISSIPAGTYVPIFGDDSSADAEASANFGQREFAFDAPSGYKALCTTNLPTPTIADGSDYFAAPVWTGDGGSSVSVTTGFEPDFIWIKQRNKTYYHQLYDAVRGYGVGKALASNANTIEGYGGSDTYGYVSATSSTGFTGTAGSGTPLYVNENNTTYVAWCWDAGSSTVSNTDGSITSSVRASQTSGFSVVSYTGSGSNATVGHGLNAALDFIIIKRRNTTGEWRCWHSALSNTQGIDLNSTSAAFTDDSFNNTIPTNSVFSIKGGVANVNASSSTYIAYCFSAVEGYSAFGSYVGNGSTDGPFVHTGFRPAALLWKPDQGATDWVFVDAKRNTYNVVDNYLLANTTGAEGTLDLIDFCSNGFKLRTSSTGNNTSGTTVVYIAWAENPFQANGGLAR